MWVELSADHRFRANKGPGSLQEVAFAIVVPFRDHRAVQAEQDDVHGCTGGDLFEDLVSQAFVGVAGD